MVDRHPGDDASGADSATNESHDEGVNVFGRYVAPLIRDRPWTVVLAFVLVTALFLGGAGGGGEQQAGADQFAEDTEAYDSMEQMEQDFQTGGREEGGTAANLFVSDERNVLSRPSLMRMLEFQELVENDDDLRVESTTSPASLTAEYIDQNATTPEAQQRVIEETPDDELTAAIAGANEEFGLPVSTDYSPTAATAEVGQVAITYDTPPMADTDDYGDLQYATADRIDEVDGWERGENVVIFGDAIIEDETLQLLGDTAIVVFPAAILLILFFLLVAYRDPLDLGLGLASLVMTMIWTFGFMGYAGIPFSDTMITVFPMLLAVGIDFGIHIINRYREERATGTPIGESMGVTTTQLGIAFLIVTMTTIIGFAANLTSSLAQLRDFGIVTSVGMAFTLAIFGVFLPAGKVGLDRLREGTRFPQFGGKPLGQEDSLLGRVLSVGGLLARAAPAVVLVAALLIGAGAAAYGTGVSTEFNEEAFFPDEDRLEQYEQLPGPLAPGEYTFMTVLDYLEEDFEQGYQGAVTVYVQDGDLREPGALDEIHEATQNPPDGLASTGREADATSLVSLIEQQRQADPEFARTVDRYDVDDDGIPDRELDVVYDELVASNPEASAYLTDDRSATRIEFQPDPDADQSQVVAAAREVADGMALDASATGQQVIFESVIEQINESAMTSLVVAFFLTGVLLIVSYWWLEGRAIYGVINLVPVVLTVALLAGSMRYFDIPLSPINAPIMSVSIGLGVDYTVHYMHRFVDEYEAGATVQEALTITASGTGGALTGSMLTTVCGLGVLYLALIPLIMEFGLLLALGIFYAYLTSMLVLPSAIAVWFAVEDRVLPAIESVTPGA